MNKVGFSLVVLLIILFTAGCASGVESTPIVAQGVVQESPPATSTAPQSSPTPSPFPSPSSTPAPSATPAPSPTPTPPPTNLTADNFSDWRQVRAYASSIEDVLGLDLFDTVMDAFAYSPDGRWIAIGGCTGNHSGRCTSDVYVSEPFLYLMDADTAEIIAQIPAHDRDVSSLAFTSDGERLFIAFYPAELVVWNIAGARVESELWSDTGSRSRPLIALSPDDAMIAVVAGTQLVVLDAATGDRLASLPAYRWTSSLPQFSVDGSRLAVFSADYGRQVAIFDTATWERISLINIPGTETDRAALSPDGRMLLAASMQVDGDILMWDVDSGEQLETLHDEFSFIQDFVFSPDGALLLIVGLSSTDVLYDGISVWDFAALQPLGRMYSTSFPSRLEFSADGSSFVANDFIIPSLYRWSLPDEDLLAVERTLLDFLTALNQGDYDAAAEHFKPNAEELAYLDSQALPTGDLPALFEYLCGQPQQPCMAVQEVLFSGQDFLGDYVFLLRLSAPDGSIYQDSYGESIFWLYADLDQDGVPFISMLPTFLYQ